MYTKAVANYIKSKGISVKTISERTGISYSVLYDSLCSKTRNRDLRADEFMAVCNFLEKDPRDFMAEKQPVA